MPKPSSKDVVVRTVGLRKPVLSRQMHLRINHRAWHKGALSKPITLRKGVR
jgi:hypothetical protein